jgi:hypothetical protein
MNGKVSPWHVEALGSIPPSHTKILSHMDISNIVYSFMKDRK